MPIVQLPDGGYVTVGEHYTIRCACGLAVRQCLCPGDRPETIFTDICARCRRIARERTEKQDAKA